jgi:glutamine synthetase
LLHQFHAEGGGGQFEFALVYDSALKIADKLFLAKEAITAAASSQNLIATFLPK